MNGCKNMREHFWLFFVIKNCWSPGNCTWLQCGDSAALKYQRKKELRTIVLCKYVTSGIWVEWGWHQTSKWSKCYHLAAMRWHHFLCMILHRDYQKEVWYFWGHKRLAPISNLFWQIILMRWQNGLFYSIRMKRFLHKIRTKGFWCSNKNRWMFAIY